MEETSNAATYEGFLANVIREIVSPLITLVGLAATVYFVWGVVQFIANAEDNEKRETGKRHMIWGLIGMVVIFGANALVWFLVGVTNANPSDVVLPR